MFGSHLSAAGGPHNALAAARDYGMDAVQIFTANQRQWHPKSLTDQAITQWQHERNQSPQTVREVVSHASYLINLANPNDEPWEKSLRLYAEEMARCQRLKIPWLVVHPGAHLNTGEPAGIKRIAAAFNHLHHQTPDSTVTTCLEITAGQGTNLGYRLEHLASIISQIHQPERMAVCLDTAHLLAAGYDLTSRKAAKAVLAEVDKILGLPRVRVWHLNDSKTPLASRVDRHAHIGHGHIALPAFAEIVNHPQFAAIPKIIELPQDKAPDGRDWNIVNLETLKSLIRG